LPAAGRITISSIPTWRAHNLIDGMPNRVPGAADKYRRSRNRRRRGKSQFGAGFGWGRPRAAGGARSDAKLEHPSGAEQSASEEQSRQREKARTYVRSYSSVARACPPPVRRNAARPVPAGADDKEEEVVVVDETAGQIKIQAAP